MKKLLPILLFFAACSGLEESEKEKLRQMNAIGEYIYRANNEYSFNVEEPKRRVRENYPWEDTYIGKHVRITKEFFRCKGSTQNQPLKKEATDQPNYIFDCGGVKQHSLPLKEGKEFIYPAQIDLLNYIQEKSRKQVIITCGHRCPTHNTYADTSTYNRVSKHMIGAEVDFYVRGLEWSPEKVIALIIQYYQETEPFSSDSRYSEFRRFEKETNVSTLPWYNKEIFLKLFKKDEGRDLDNDHKFPYLSLQIRWDRDTQEAVTYTWPKAFNGYLRY